ncbi:hypothetical protein CPB85DRAFT_99420 [Mucidula mucida]|nr:hypothetical protein CPB85DRAFT_99420 [Mucidula mucida]
MSQGYNQSSSSNQGFQQTTSSSWLHTQDWNPSWLPNHGFSSLSIPPPWVEAYSSRSCPATTFYLLPQPGSHVASNVVLCAFESTSFTRTSHHWHRLYSEFRRRSDGCTLLVQTEHSAFLPVDAVAEFVALLWKTHAPYISLEVQLLQSSFSLSPCKALRRWSRVIIKKFVTRENSNVCGTTLPLRLAFSPRDHPSTLCLYLDVSKSSTRDTESIMAVIDLILSLDATIMFDDLHVEGSYAPLVVELLPALLGDKRRLRLQGLPAVHSVACTLLSLGVKLPAALVFDLSSPNAIDTFLSRLPWILASIPDERRSRPLHVHLCFKYDAVLSTQDGRLWSHFDNILAHHDLALITIASLDVDDVPDSKLKTLLSLFLPKTQKRVGLRGSHSSMQMMQH